MQTREEAVQWLHEHGLFAKPRDWSFGKSICVWSSEETASGGITVCQDLICLHPEADQWWFSDLATEVRRTKPCGTLAAAVRVAAEHFGAKSCPGSSPTLERQPSGRQPPRR